MSYVYEADPNTRYSRNFAQATFEKSPRLCFPQCIVSYTIAVSNTVFSADQHDNHVRTAGDIETKRSYL